MQFGGDPIDHMTHDEIRAAIAEFARVWLRQWEVVDDPEDIRIHRFDRLLAPVIPQPFEVDPLAQKRADMGGAIEDVTGGYPTI